MRNTVKLEWRADDPDVVCYSQTVRWRVTEGLEATAWFWIERRPAHCDRGRFIVKTTAPLDGQEGWPRYYFDLDVAKAEAQRWVNMRQEILAK